jgi:TolA-binding protein
VRAAAALAGVPRESLGVAERGRVEAATRELVTALGTRPDDYRAEDALANFLLERGEVARAVAAFETAARLAPESPAVRVNAAAAYEAAGRRPDAERSLRAALDLAPSYAPAHLALGLLLADEGRTSEAESSLRQALAAEPGLAPAAYNLSLLLSDRRSPEALLWARRAAGWRPDVARYAYGLAYLERESGDAAGAVGRLRELVRVHPESELVPDALYFIGESFRTENADSAAAYYDMVARSYPQSPRAASALYNLGLLNERAQKTAAARDAYQRVVQTYPKSDEAGLARDRLKALGR